MIVVKYFIDKTDKSEYNPGDMYPREGLEVSEARIADLTAKGYISEKPKAVPEERPVEPVDEKPAKKSKQRKKKE